MRCGEAEVSVRQKEDEFSDDEEEDGELDVEEWLTGEGGGGRGRSGDHVDGNASEVHVRGPRAELVAGAPQSETG